MQVTVNNVLDDSSIVLDLYVTSTVLNVKERLLEEWGLIESHYNLYCEGLPLNDNDRVVDKVSQLGVIECDISQKGRAWVRFRGNPPLIRDFFQEIKNQNIQAIKDYLSAKVNTSQALGGITAIALSAKKNFTEISYLILSSSDNPTKDVNQSSSYGGALYWGAHHNDTTLVSEICSLPGAKVNMSGRWVDKQTPSHAACRQDSLESLKILCGRKDVDFELKTTEGWSPFEIACFYHSYSCIEFLISEKKDFYGVGLLIHCCCGNDEEIITYLLQLKKFNINIRNPDNGETVLHYCCREGLEDMVRLLCSSKKININSPDVVKRTPLHFAVSYRQSSVVRLLSLHNEINPNVQRPNIATPLWTASSMGSVDIVRSLLEIRKIDLNMVGFQSTTPLQIAEKKGNLEIAKILRDAGGY